VPHERSACAGQADGRLVPGGERSVATARKHAPGLPPDATAARTCRARGTLLQGTSHDFLQCETSAAANESYVLEGKCTPLVTSERTASSIHNGGIQHTATVKCSSRGN
jgi:hypothetical protein